MPGGASRGLRAFCAAARHLSFKLAAEELHVTPSAVSHQVKSLEERLQAELFERRTRELTLTYLGSELFAQVEPLLYQLDTITARFEQRNRRSRVLRIGVTPFFASELLIPRIAGFAEQHRGIDLRVETVAAGAQHVPGYAASILLLPTPPVDVVALPLFALRLTPVCAPQLAALGAEPRTLLNTTLIVDSGRPNAWHDWFARMGVVLDRTPKAIHVDGMLAVARAAECGLGVALLPPALAQHWLGNGTLARPCAGELDLPDRYYFVHRREVGSDPDVIALRDWVAAAFAAERANADSVALQPNALRSAASTPTP